VTCSARLTRWITRQFPAGAADRVLAEIGELPEAFYGGQDPERIQASLVLRAEGDWYTFQQWVDLAQMDFRDALEGSGLGGEDWRAIMDETLGAGAQADLRISGLGDPSDQ
jgi:hypothetical protein